jgi:nitrile hydratase
MSHEHTHDHEHQAAPSDPALRVKALESLLVEKGLVDPAALDALIDTYQHKVLARKEAWADAYRHTPHEKPVELSSGSKH